MERLTDFPSPHPAAVRFGTPYSLVGLFSKIYKQLIEVKSEQTITATTTTTTKKKQSKMGRKPKQTFSKECKLMTSRHIKTCSTSVIIRDANQNHNEASLHSGQNGHQ